MSMETNGVDAMRDGSTPVELTATLTKLVSAANLKYSIKHYEEAAEIYSQATELQARLNGELNPLNAELFFLYGRCLYKTALAKSDILGGQAAVNSKMGLGPVDAEAGSEAMPDVMFQPLHDIVEEEEGDRDDEDDEEDDEDYEEGSEDGDEEDEDDEDDEEPSSGKEDQEDEFGNAWDVLDIARVLYTKLEEELEHKRHQDLLHGKGKGKAAVTDGPVENMSVELRATKERLSDVHDMQSEISLGNERFADAVDDAQLCLKLRKQLHPNESSLVAEAYYKLGLAQDFAYVAEARAAENNEGPRPAPKGMYDAIENMARAIISCEERIKRESQAPDGQDDDAAARQKEITEVQEIVEEMLERLSLLKLAAEVTLSSSKQSWDRVFAPEIVAIMKRVKVQQPQPTTQETLAEILGGAAAIAGSNGLDGVAAAKLAAQMTAQATDLTGLVRKKKDVTGGAAIKRKADDDLESSDEKKPKA